MRRRSLEELRRAASSKVALLLLQGDLETTVGAHDRIVLGTSRPRDISSEMP